MLCYWCLLTAARAARSVELQLLKVQIPASVQVSYRVTVNQALEWSDADMQVCIWRAFTSPTATPYSIGSVQAAECYLGPSGVASVRTAQAGTYVIKAVNVSRGIAEFNSAEALSEIAVLSITVNEQLQIEVNGPAYNNDANAKAAAQFT
jgi:hypothetical protein